MKKLELLKGFGVDFSKALPSSVELLAGRIPGAKIDSARHAVAKVTDLFEIAAKLGMSFELFGGGARKFGFQAIWGEKLKSNPVLEKNS